MVVGPGERNTETLGAGESTVNSQIDSKRLELGIGNEMISWR